jgi:organic hydroperoxide reductase OsmC/OhrA
MKTLFTAEAISKGGRPGTFQTPDGLLNVTLGNPLEKSLRKLMAD